MKIKISPVIFILSVIFMSSCASQNKNISFPVPDYNEGIRSVNLIDIDNIIENKNGYGSSALPDWLTAYINGGVEDIEKIELYSGNYCFIGRNEGVNFEALNKWTGNYSVIQDFPRLAAARIEERLIFLATLYPDDEYGLFYEKLIKKTFDAEYPSALMEDTYWIKKSNANTNTNGFTDIYEFFVFISIDKVSMQIIINKMIEEAHAAVTPTRAQNTAINRLRQNFFEGF